MFFDFIFGIANTVSNSIAQHNQLELQREQLALQRQQHELQVKSYYDSMTSQYYSYMGQLEEMRSQQASAGIAINQAREDIASNNLFINRWQSEYDNAVGNAVDQSFNAYAEQAAAFGASMVSAGETGRKGGSAAVVSGVERRNLKNMVGDSLSFNLNDNPLASYINSTAQDLLAERQTALSGINTGYQAIASYQDAIKEFGFAMESMGSTTQQIKNELKKQGRFV